MNKEIFTFELVLERELSEDELNKAFDAGFDDVVFGVSNGIPIAGFEREAVTLADAVIDSINELERAIPKLTVVKVVNPDIVTLPMTAELTRRSRQSVHQLATGKRGPGGWPDPVDSTVDPKHRLWRFTDIAEWWTQYEPEGPINAERAHTLAAINAHLSARQELAHLPKPLSRKISALAA